MIKNLILAFKTRKNIKKEMGLLGIVIVASGVSIVTFVIALIQSTNQHPGKMNGPNQRDFVVAIGAAGIAGLVTASILK